MNPQASLDRLAQRLSDAENLFKKVRVLVDLESAPLSLRSLSDPVRIASFLNTLSDRGNEYLAFIRHRPAFYLLRVASFGEQVPLGAGDLQGAVGLLTSAVRAFKDLKPPPEGTPAPANNLLENSNILTRLSQFIAHLRSLDLSQPVTFTPPASLVTLRCIEEITFSFWHAHWTAPPEVSLPKPNPQSKLERWLALSYAAALGAARDNAPKHRRELRALAKSLLTTERDLFAPVSVVTETSLTLPLAKERAREIFSMVDDALPGDAAARGAPVLGFRDADLNAASPEYVFLYEHVFEALLHDQTYGCARRTVEAFLERCLKFLVNLGSYVQTACSNKSHLSPPEIEGVRAAFHACGLTREACHTFSTMLAIAPAGGAASRLKHLHATVQHLEQITVFGRHFYECLRRCSPTSISHRLVREVLRTAQVEQNSATPWTAGAAEGSALGWPVHSYLRIFLPRPPEDDLAATFKAASESNFMKSLIGVSVKRDWDLNKFYVLSKKAPGGGGNGEGGSGGGNGGAGTVSRKQVRKFCEGLNPGDADYALEVVQSKYFAPEFARAVLLPELEAMLRGRVRRHVMLFRLRWLVLFAFEDAAGLAHIRRPLTLAYFQLTEIFGQGGVGSGAGAAGGGDGGALGNLLDHFHEAWTAARELVPEAGGEVPHELLTNIYRSLHAPAAREQLAAAAAFLKEIKPLVEGTWNMMRIASVLCHARYNYLSASGHLRVPFGEKPGYVDVPVPVFKETVKIMESSLHETLVILSQACQDLQRFYAACLGILDQNQFLATHPVQLDLSEPDFQAVKETLLGCLRRYREVASLAAGSCCFSLTRHFGALFDPPLITEAVVRKVLEFSEERDTTDAFIESLQQPIAKVEEEDWDDAPPKHALNDYDLTALREINESFPLPKQHGNNPPETTPSIKLSYTDSVNVSQITLDWEKFLRTSYIPQDAITSEFSHITVKKLEQSITGSF
ncbi:tegument protein UL37 [Equid gammaherpesvirus 2]|uniref:Inner tegument protein n=1 Tax=Equine herpesvirus 2 (strain 86/87) TaxID=82831 RepID=ITP_EHV2|nr:tegument protein UL37 [Equid gammaherpesvirus 2]Q66665.1 RecName: Full=Inner tegument protein [Equid herpesvirus type 2 strain 86/87]AAC13851.1 tegument protein UL37 [Equid gammaherpesvirus 2]